MKERLKNWLTSIIGIMLMLFAAFLIYEQYPEKYIYISFGMGLASLFAKDDLIKKLLAKV